MVIKNAFIHFISTKKTLRQNPQSLDFIELMAERVGFEPTVPVKGHLISSCIRHVLNWFFKIHQVPSALDFTRFVPSYILTSFKSSFWMIWSLRSKCGQNAVSCYSPLARIYFLFLPLPTDTNTALSTSCFMIRPAMVCDIANASSTSLRPIAFFL